MVKLDRIDMNILRELQHNGRISNADLAERVSLSPSPCLQRVRKLQHAGFITGYSAQIDAAKLGAFITIFAEVTLKRHLPEDIDRFQKSVEQLDELIECHLISAGYDYLLKFIVSSIAEYQSIMESLVDSQAGIEKYFSFVVMKSPIIKAHLPLGKLSFE